jgi:hypothetical protein
VKAFLAVALLSLQPAQPIESPPNVQLISRSCGIEPVAPKGCQVNSCVCDSVGTNCHWLFFCGFCCRYDSYIQPINPRLPNYGNVMDGFPGARPRNRVNR